MRFLALVAACIFSLMSLSALAADTSDPQSFGGGFRSSTYYCAGATFDCDSLSSNQAAIIDAANACVASHMGIQDKIMTMFTASDEITKNCVTPSSTDGLPVWAVCCMKKSDGLCDLVCTRYLAQGK